MKDLLISLQSLKESSILNDLSYHQMIQEKVLYLLEHEISLLFQLLYRIDISEEKVKLVFQEYNETINVSEQLTVLIIDRLKQKIDLRTKYST